MIRRAARRARHPAVALFALTATTIASPASHGATTPATAPPLSAEATDIVDRALSRFGQCPGGTGFDVQHSLDVYAAIFHRDVVRFARLLNEDLDRELSDLEKEEKAYTLEKRFAAIQRDSTIAAAFKSVVGTLKKASFCALADLPVFRRGQFWAVVSSGFRIDGDKLFQGILFAPDGVGEEPGDDELTVGGWSRFSCTDEEDGSSSCGVALAGLPRNLKDQIETESGTAVTGLWRWTGLPRPQRSTFLGFNGLRFRNVSAILWAPQNIRFEILSNDSLVWTLR
jgi:hypothetical protein